MAQTDLHEEPRTVDIKVYGGRSDAVSYALRRGLADSTQR